MAPTFLRSRQDFVEVTNVWLLIAVHDKMPHSSATAKGIEEKMESVNALASEEMLVVAKTALKPIFDELTQLFGPTCSTSCGSAKVISTHWRKSARANVYFLCGIKVTYAVQRCTMQSSLHDLNGRVVANLR